jgi:pSer/pThr/pTyr-binding forkhead associated (FHA) protein
MDWNLLLFILKWILLGLVYLVLLLVLVGVTREMRQRLPQTAPQTSISYGRLRVLQAGSDPRLRPGTILTLQPETNLGAQKGNTIILRDQFISGHHARVRWDGVSWWVEDLNSTNGTLINRQRIAPGAAEPFPPGAVLEVGDMAFEMLD